MEGTCPTPSLPTFLSTEQAEALPFYVDHSRDPIINVLAFIYCRSSAARPASDAPYVATDETSRITGQSLDPGTVRSGDQDQEDEFRVLGSGSRPASFPWLLYCMLEDSLAHGTDEIVSWGSHGRAFRIHDRKAFESRIMPR